MYIMSNPNDKHMFTVTFSLIELIINEKNKQKGIESTKITVEMINQYLPDIEKHLPGIKKHLPSIYQYISNQSDNSEESPKVTKHHKDQYRKITNSHEYFGSDVTNVPKKDESNDSYTPNPIHQLHYNQSHSVDLSDESSSSESSKCHSDKEECIEMEFDSENIDVLRESVIEHSNSLITCYQEKISSCEEHKEQLKKCLNKCQTKKDCLEEKLKCCHSSLDLCEDEKKRIMKKAKKCEKKILSLTEKYQHLKNEYEKKNNELAKCQYQNEILLKEIAEIKKELERCVQCKNKLRQKVEKLHQCLQTCKTDKNHLQQTIHELKEKLEKCKAKNQKLKCENEKLQEKIASLNETIQTLKCQNDELKEENADLKCKLSKAIKTIKCLCHKYKCLKKLCFSKYC